MTKVLLTAFVLAASFNAFGQNSARVAAKPAPAQTQVGQAQAGLAKLVQVSGGKVQTPNLTKYAAVPGSGFSSVLAKFAANDPSMTAAEAETAIASMEADARDGVSDWSSAYAVAPAKTVNEFSLKIVQGVKSAKGTTQAAVMAKTLYPSCGTKMTGENDIKGAQACFAAACSN